MTPDRPKLESKRNLIPIPQGPASRRWIAILIWMVLVASAMWALTGKWKQDDQHVSYSAFKQAVAESRVTAVTLTDTLILGTVAPEPGTFETTEPKLSGKPTTRSSLRWQANRVPRDADLIPLLEKHNVDYRFIPSSSCTGGWSWILSFGLIFLLWSFVLRRMAQSGHAAGGMMAFGKSKARVQMVANTGVSFSDVAGIDEAVEELREIVAFLETPERFRRLGGKIPKGVLLVGPPGTGKTLLARAVAGEAKVPFFSLTGSEFVEMFVGVGAARVRDLFQQAQGHAPCIIFIDELDALGKVRSAAQVTGGHEEREQTLNQLLAEMDGFDPRVGLIVLAATNRPEVLDPALMRAGRFDRNILVDRPDRRGRLGILKLHAKQVRLSDSVDLDVVAARTPGFAGADLANLINEAALLAARRDAEAITMNDLDLATERLIAGLQQKSRCINDNERRVVAVHEAGHALVGLRLKHADPVHKVSIVPRGYEALGYTLQLPLEDRFLHSQDELEDRMVGLLGGRAAEEITFGSVTTGAANDLQQATDLARRMVVDFGMSDLGPIALGSRERTRFITAESSTALEGNRYSERTAQLIDGEVKRLLASALDRARKIVAGHQPALDRIAAELLREEVLDGTQLKALADGGDIR